MQNNLLINGKLVAGEGEAVPVFNPASGEEIVSIAEATPAQVERLVAKTGFSRFPTLDAAGEISGYLHLKDVLYAGEADYDLPVPTKRHRRLATVRPEDEVEDVLATMQQTGSHLARVVDPDGHTQSVVFLEDVLEELVGEVLDASQRS